MALMRISFKFFGLLCLGVLNVKALVGAFNQEKALVGAFNQVKALVGAFSGIVHLYNFTDGSFHSTSLDMVAAPAPDQHWESCSLLSLHHQ